MNNKEIKKKNTTLLIIILGFFFKYLFVNNGKVVKNFELDLVNLNK
jgi:hypothetical protein